MRPRLASALLAASGHVGALGPILAAATARAADLLTQAAERVAPLVECPGCGAAVPSLDLEVVGCCGPCAEREAVAPPPRASAGHPDPRVNVATYHHRAAKPEEPS